MNKAIFSEDHFHQMVTNRFLASLEDGVVPWRIPRCNPGFPLNLLTGRPYRGIDALLLWSTPFSSPFWITVDQLTRSGGSVQSGEKVSVIFLRRWSDRHEQASAFTTNDAGSNSHSAAAVLPQFVLNVEQCEGLTIPTAPAYGSPTNATQRCASIVNAWAKRPTIRTEVISEGRAYYQPATDSVHLPAAFRFIDTAHYYAALFHELVHSTAHKSRLARHTGNELGAEPYSREELTADLGAAMLCASAGIATRHSRQNDKAYIRKWIIQFEKNRHLVVQAANSAQAAVNLIIGHRRENQTAENEGGSAEGTGAPPFRFAKPLAT